jgi:hypothetical protein
VARLAGSPPLLWAGEVESPRAKSAGRAVVYLDVSGSMDPYLPLLYGALTRLKERVDPQVRAFSTQVAVVRVEALARGKVPSTGGTDAACVFEHALAAGARKILVVTDGYVGPPKAAMTERIRKARLDVRVLLTPNGWRPDLAGIASRFVPLPELSDSSQRRSA